MKKLILICIAVCLLFAAYESRIELPPVDNTTPAEELITHTYSDADLALIDENYDNILDLARDYKIECIRDPREFFENYLPYIVLYKVNFVSVWHFIYKITIIFHVL